MLPLAIYKLITQPHKEVLIKTMVTMQHDRRSKWSFHLSNVLILLFIFSIYSGNLKIISVGPQMNFDHSFILIEIIQFL